MAAERRGRISNQATILALGAAMLGFALHINDGLYSLPAFCCLSAAFGLCLIAVFAPPGAIGSVSDTTLRVILIVLVSAQLLAMFFKTAGASEATVPITDQRPFYAGLGLAFV